LKPKIGGGGEIVPQTPLIHPSMKGYLARVGIVDRQKMRMQ